MATITTRFAGFAHAAEELSAYGKTLEVFIIALRTGEVIHHTPKDAKAFEQWLQEHRIRDVDKG
ncbi:MAG: hypothetical protein R2800_01675 [Flavipsychrobacter sp.]